MRHLLGITLILLAPVTALSETVSITVPTNFVPDKAVGIVISKDAFREKREAKMKKISEHAVEVSFEVDRRDLGEDTVMTAAVKSKDGKVGYGPMRSLGAAQKGKEIPACQPPTIDDVRLREQIGVLGSLIEIRKNRRDVAQKKLENLLSVQTMDKYRTLEEGFGLAKNQKLSHDINPYELTGRLSRLLLVIKSYNELKSK